MIKRLTSTSILTLDLTFYHSSTENMRALMHGEIEALSLEAGVPASAIILAKRALGDEMVILDFSDAQLARAGEEQLSEKADWIGNTLVNAFRILGMFVIGGTIVWSAIHAYVETMRHGRADLHDSLLLFIGFAPSLAVSG